MLAASTPCDFSSAVAFSILPTSNSIHACGIAGLPGPLIGAKAGLSRLRQRAQGKMFHATELACIQIAVGILFELQTQCSGVELAACGLTANDRTKTGNEKHVDAFPCFYWDLVCCLSKSVARLPRSPTECNGRSCDPNPREHRSWHANMPRPLRCFPRTCSGRAPIPTAYPTAR